MKRLDVLIVREMVAPWLFGVAIFTVLILAGTYLFKITDYIVKGVPPETIGEFSLLILPGIMAKTFPMAVLLAALLSFGRLSGDSEIVAMKAAGSSVLRIMTPVAGFGLVVAVLAFGFNEIIVPQAALRATNLQAEVAKRLTNTSARPTFYPVEENGRLVATVTAKDFNFGARTLRGAHVMAYDKSGKPSYLLLANELEYESDRKWRLRGGGQLMSMDGSTLVRLNGDAWPSQVPQPGMSPEDILTATLRDLDSFSMAQMHVQIERARQNPKFERKQIANLEYGYWNKIALPLAALVYALVGAPLGIRNHRAGVASGFWIAVVVIFGYMMVANLMAISAQGGAIPAWTASFTPLLVGLAAAAVSIVRKNA